MKTNPFVKVWTSILSYLCFGMSSARSTEYDERPKAKIAINDLNCQALFDTGSQATLLNWQTFLKLKRRPSLERINVSLNAANGSGLTVLGKTDLRFDIGGHECVRPTIIVKGLAIECIIGHDTITAEAIVIDAKGKKLIF